MSQKTYFYSFQAKVFENLISKNNFQPWDGSEYVSNLSHMIKIIILDVSYSHLDPYKGLYSDSEKKILEPLPLNKSHAFVGLSQVSGHVKHLLFKLNRLKTILSLLGQMS